MYLSYVKSWAWWCVYYRSVAVAAKNRQITVTWWLASLAWSTGPRSKQVDFPQRNKVEGRMVPHEWMTHEIYFGLHITAHMWDRYAVHSYTCTSIHTTCTTLLFCIFNLYHFMTEDSGLYMKSHQMHKLIFNFSHSNLYVLISFPCLLTIPKILSATSNRSFKASHACPFPYVKWIGFIHSCSMRYWLHVSYI